MAKRGYSSRSVHSGERDGARADSLTIPIYQTATFWFKNSDELRAYQEGRHPRDEYGRYGNPTWRAVEHKVADLDGADDAVLFGSGMSVTTASVVKRIPAREPAF